MKQKFYEGEVSPYVLPGLMKGFDMKLKPLAVEVDLPDILALVAKRTGFEPEEIISAERKRGIPIARHIFCKVARIYTKHTLKSISDFLGRKDHTTVISSIKVANNLIETDKYVKSLYLELETALVAFSAKNSEIRSLHPSLGQLYQKSI